MRYAQIRNLDITNGDGLGIALFVQGCHFHCKDCFNKETWDFNGGKDWNANIENHFFELARKNHIKRISILGGEPLADENTEKVFEIICDLKYFYPEKKIWLYTGYTFEELLNDNKRRKILNHIDILCDGKFITELKDPLNKEVKYVGSTNQRVLDVKKSLEILRPCSYKKET